MKPIVFKLVLALTLVLGTAFQAQADIVLTPGLALCGSPVCLEETGNNNQMATIHNYITSTYGVDALYKNEVDTGDEEGAAAAWYQTEYFNEPDDPKDGTISWVGPGFVSSNPVYVLVKDGNMTPAWYLFNISGWNGTETIQLNDFWPRRGAISNVTIYGTSTSVPDGGSMAMLLGLGLLGIATVRRRLM